MPCQITNDNGIIWIRLSGCVTVSDITDGLAMLEALEASRDIIPPRITDLTKVTDVDLPFDIVKRLTCHRKVRTYKNAYKAAIVAPHSIHIGFARMFQSLMLHPQVSIVIFSDMASAVAWISEENATA